MPTIKVTFDVDNKQVSIEDITDYVGMGIGAASGLVRIIDPWNNIVYENSGFGSDTFTSPDTVYPGTLTFNQNLPEDNGSLINGTYAISYKIQHSGSTIEETSVNAVLDTTVLPTLCIETKVDCKKVMVSSCDITNYGAIAQITGRTNTLIPPTSSGQPNVSTPNAITSTTNVWTKTWTAELSVTLLYDYGDYCMTASLTTKKDFGVDCVGSLCTVYKCIGKLNEAVKNTPSQPASKKEELEKALGRAIDLLFLVTKASECGETEDIQDYLDELTSLTKANTGCDCGCEDCTEEELSVQIIPPCSEGATVIAVAAGSGISVTSNTAGGVTTYTVALSATMPTVTISDLGDKELDVKQVTGGPAYSYEVTSIPPGVWAPLTLEAAITPASLNAYLPDRRDPGYRKERRYTRADDSADAAIVRVSGAFSAVLSTPLIPLLVATLPVGFRPEADVMVVPTIYGLTLRTEGQMYIRTNGEIWININNDVPDQYFGTGMLVEFPDVTFEVVEP